MSEGWGNYLGIDPGKSGGLALITMTGMPTPFKVTTWKMPATEADLWEVLERMPKGTLAILERVHAMPKQGVTSCFTFGQGYGMLKMGLIAARISFINPTPQAWMKRLSFSTKGDKNNSKRKAQELFPMVPKITHAIADALLLAEYGRRMHSETVSKSHRTRSKL